MTTTTQQATVTLTWQSYDQRNELVTRAVPVLPDGATDQAVSFGEIPGIRNPRIDTARTVQLGDVPAPRYGWSEAERDEVPMFPLSYTPQAVRCPKCKEPAGMPCRSTGGGNRIAVPTHKARSERVAGWTNAVQEHAAMLVKAVGHYGYGNADLFAAFELAAAPIQARAAKQPTPKGVRISEKQAEEIERMVACGGRGGVSTGHFHGDHEERQTVNALEAKGIVEWTGLDDHGTVRTARLTEFGWAVYDQHRLIIKRLTDEQVAERVKRAEEGRCVPCGSQPGEGPEGCDLCDLERWARSEADRQEAAANR